MNTDANWRVAIIEDDSPTAAEYRRYLQEIWPGCRIEEYADAESAMKAVTESDFDLVISDIKLGEGADRRAGIRIANALDVKRTPLLVVSGLPEPELHREVFKALDAWDYLQKPIEKPDFITQVTRAIAFREATLRDAPYPSTEEALKVRVPNLVLNYRAKDRILWHGDRVALPFNSFFIVELMASRPNVAVPSKELWAFLPSGRNIQNLRQRIAEINEAFRAVDPKFDCIKNMKMVGYFWRV
jgi:DNA-binding response OmpR family regulator